MLNLAWSVVYVGLSLWLLIGGAAQRHGTDPLITGIFMLAISAPMLAASIGICVRPMIIEDGVLRIHGRSARRPSPYPTFPVSASFINASIALRAGDWRYGMGLANEYRSSAS